VSAYVAVSKSEYLARRVQAIGRALRSGQSKDVHIYDFLMAKTLEVNIIQERHEGALVQREDGTYGLEKRNDSEPTPLEGPNMQGAASGLGAVDLTEVEE
jgi:superfamily II DNA or RNA helicase